MTPISPGAAPEDTRRDVRVHDFDVEPDLLERFLAFPSTLRAGEPDRRADVEAARLLGAGPGDWPRSHGAVWRNFLAVADDGQTLGRLTAIVNPAFADAAGRPYGQLGFLEMVDEPAVARALVDAALGWLRRRAAGVRTVLAPMSFDVWHAYRLRTGGFEEPTFPGEPDNPASYPGLLRACGFVEVSAHVTKTIHDPAAAVARWARLHARARAHGIAFRAADGRHWPEDLGRVHGLSHEAFGDLAYFTPLPEAEFRALYASVGAALEPDGLVFAEAPGRAPVGFCYSFRQPGRPGDVFVKTFGVLPAWRGLGLAPALACEVYRRWLARGARRVHHCLMAAGEASERFDRGAGVVTRRYGLFGRPLDRHGP